MIVTLTNNVGFTIPLTITDGNGNAVSYGLAPGASGVTLTMPDNQQNELIGYRQRGWLSYTYTQLPNAAPVYPSTARGRTEVTGTTYTIQSTDRECTLDCLQACTITLPSNLPRGFNCTVLQYGTGKATFTPGTGATMRIPGTATGTSAQYATANLYVRDNNGPATNEWVVSGSVS